MSTTWSRALEIDRLADAQSDVDFAGALAELPALGSLRGGVAGTVRGRAHFSREQALVVVDLAVQGSARLECQRCLKPMELTIDNSTRIALIAAESDSAGVPDDLEPVLAAGGRISIGQLVSEELLLTLPIVPLHGSEASCARSLTPAERPRAADTHRPFAGLASLLKR